MKMTALTRLSAMLFLATFGLAMAAAAADLPPASTKQGVTYAADIKPIFENSCVKCHSGDKPKARLRLDSLENALKGSKDGKVITVGDSAKSLMVKCVAHATSDSDMWMPPPHNKAGIGPLTPEQIGLLRAWIDQGAK